MPIMPRTSGKCQKIADDILGKKPKKTTKPSKKEQKLNFEESSKIK